MLFVAWQYADTGEEKNEQSRAARELAVVLDTALVQALLHTDNISMALQLLSGPNFADVGACEDIMLEGSWQIQHLSILDSDEDDCSIRGSDCHNPLKHMLKKVLTMFPISPCMHTSENQCLYVNSLNSNNYCV